MGENFSSSIERRNRLRPGYERQPDTLTTWFRQRKFANLPPSRKVLDLCTIEPLKCLQEDDLFGVEANVNVPDPSPEPPIYAMRFCPVPGYERLLGIANEDGMMAIQDINSKEAVTGPLPGWSAHHNAIFDFAWCNVDASKLVTVSGDESARAFDLNYQQGASATLVTAYVGYQRSVKCCEWRPGSGHEFCTGDRANTILLWDTRTSDNKRPDNSIREAHANQNAQSLASVTSLLWLDTNTLVSVSGNDGIIKVWDVRKNYSLYKNKPVPKEEIIYPGTSFSQGYTSLVRSPGSPYFFASCQDNIIYQYNALAINNRPVNIFTGAEISSFFIKSSVSLCDNFLASGSSDNQIYLWNTRSPGSHVATLGPQEEKINCVTWNYAENILATCTDDSRHRIWRPSRCQDKLVIKGWSTFNTEVNQNKVILPPTTPSSGLRSVYTPDRRRFTPDGRSARTPGRGGRTPSIKTFLTPKSSVKLTPTRTPTRNDQQQPTTPVSLSRSNSQKRRLDLTDSFSSPSKAVKLDVEVVDSINQLITTTTSNVVMSPTAFRSPHKTPRKLESPLKKIPLLSSPLSGSNECCSPTKTVTSDTNKAEAVRRPLTPLFSPLKNLPNLVLFGTTSRHICSSARKGGRGRSSCRTPQQSTTNWLQKLGQQHRLGSEKKEQKGGASSKPGSQKKEKKSGATPGKNQSNKKKAKKLVFAKK